MRESEGSLGSCEDPEPEEVPDDFNRNSLEDEPTRICLPVPDYLPIPGAGKKRLTADAPKNIAPKLEAKAQQNDKTDDVNPIDVFAGLKEAAPAKQFAAAPDTYCCFSSLFLHWNLAIVLKGWKTPIQDTDLPDLKKSFTSLEATGRLQKLWQKERSSAKPSLLRALMRLQTRRLVLGTTVFCMHGLLAAAGRPLMLKVVVNAVGYGNLNDYQSVGMLLGLGCVIFIEGWFAVLGRHMLQGDVTGETVGALFPLMLKKVMSNSTSAFSANQARDHHNNPKGAVQSDEVALFGSDVTRTMANLQNVSQLGALLGSFLGGCAFLIWSIGVAALAGIAFMVAILLLNIRFSSISGKIESETLGYADKRLSILSQMIDSIKAVKFFAWEDNYLQKIDDVRSKECKTIRRWRMWQVTSVSLGRSSPVLSSCIAIVTYMLLGGTLDAGSVFSTIAVFQALRLSLIMAPQFLTSWASLKVSIGRIQRYLEQEERAACVTLPEGSENVLEIKDGSFSWQAWDPAADPVLSHINLTCKQGTLTAVVGRVGCGKSSLVSSILGELLPFKGTRLTHPSIGYVPQRPVIISGTVLENLLMGRPLDKAKAEQALSASAFLHDLKNLPNGLASEIGERGTTLSGGQQQRLGIARAMYDQPQLLLLDDPLSAVDAEVCNHIFEHAVKGHIKRGGSVIMVCNQLHLLDQCDHIVVLQSGGIERQGSPMQILSNGTLQLQSRSQPQIVISGIDGPRESTTHRDSSNKSKEKSRKVSASAAEMSGMMMMSHLAALDQEVSKLQDDEAEKEAELEEVKVLVKSEVKHGAVQNAIVRTYIRWLGIPWVLVTMVVILVGYSVMGSIDFYLASIVGSTTTDPGTFVGIYVGLTATFASMILIASFMFAHAGYRASLSLHTRCLEQVLGAPMSWFQETPSGRITSRFSADMAAVDQMLSFSMDNFIQLSSTLLTLVLAVCIIVPPVWAVVAVSLGGFWFIVEAVDRSNREIKRLANNGMSPVLTNVREVIGARELLHAMGLHAFFVDKQIRYTDDYVRAQFSTMSLLCWLQIMANVMSFFISFFAACYIVLADQSIGVGRTGLALMYSFLLPYFFGMLAMIASFIKTLLTSLERLMEYRNLPQEAPRHVPGDKQLRETGWPDKGEIVYQNAALQYREGLGLALKDLTLTIAGGTKVGVVGRTGAGKSSLLALTFRLVEPFAGKVMVDGVDSSTIGLKALRKAITIIPQDPILMEGSVRRNLDPFDHYGDDDVMAALTKARLPPEMINDEVGKGGFNISAGQRQLLCFARALLHQARIVIMDEPTASCDPETDELLQAMVREEFANCTLITIAHRLNTIIDYDKVLVMADGRLAEYDTPSALLKKKHGQFRAMVNALGKPAAKQLEAKADKALKLLAEQEAERDHEEEAFPNEPITIGL